LGLTSALLTNHTGAKVGVVASFRNLASLRRLEEQLRRSQHLAALGQMAAGVAHEIRNPLNSVRGFSQLITEKAAQDCAGKGPCAEYGRIIVEEVDRMNRIIQDLLDYSRQRELTLVSLQVDQVLMEVVKEMEPQFRTAQVTLRLDLPEATVPAAMGNEDKLHQVFRNILLNALQASKAGSEVAARVHVAPAAGAKEGGRREIAVEVEDRGEGIPAAYLTRIFDPFFTLKDVGTGLGLSISQKIMDQHGGRIEVKSREGNGSTFAVCLPVPPPDGKPPAPATPATPAAPA
jgi:signal transduction histidine kinase